MKKLIWKADESIRAMVSSADPVQDEPDNRKVLEACQARFGEVRMRVNIGAYGPGTTAKPTPRYWWMLGENATVVCRNPDVANWFRDELKNFIQNLDGVVLEASGEEKQ